MQTNPRLNIRQVTWANPVGADLRAAQQAELALLQGYADNGESTDIKPAAAKAVAKTQAHLDKVHELQAAMK